MKTNLKQNKRWNHSDNTVKDKLEFTKYILKNLVLGQSH